MEESRWKLLGDAGLPLNPRSARTARLRLGNAPVILEEGVFRAFEEAQYTRYAFKQWPLSATVDLA